MVENKKNDVILRDTGRWLYFSDPHKIICAEKPADVIPALLDVERLVNLNDWHAAGFISYEAAFAFDSALPTKPTGGFPYLWFGLYPEPRVIHLPNPNQPKEVLNWYPTVDREDYHAAISKIREYIADGKTYQVNFTMRLQADFNSSPWNLFLHLIQGQNDYAAYIDMGSYVICSASPELFFQVDGENITCRPMKGTATRGRTALEDQGQAEWLRNSEKNRAENVMIVDMIRNDLGRIAKTGSVQVAELFCVERYPTLLQMTSTTTARTSASLTQIFQALFPSASITGAPKVSTMKIIHELEAAPRKIYTGTIGYVSPQRKARFNVAIRTALIDREIRTAEYGVGGGIVWDSNSPDEYAEALLKAQILSDSQPEFSLLETMLWTPDEGYYLYKKHMDRLLDSAKYFDFDISGIKIQEQLEEAASNFHSPQRVRLLVDRNGNVKTESAVFLSKETLIPVHLANRPVNSENTFLFHKTTQREVYENARADLSDYDDVLLYNERGEVTEFTIGNLVLELDGQLVTPPIECGLLAGTFRAYLLETNQVIEKIVPIQRLKDCTKYYRINSIRRWETVHISL